jgi:excisionase family DNA binding protein
MIKSNTGEQIVFTGISVDDLLLRIEQIFDTKISSQLPKFIENQSEYITRKEVSSLLKVCLVTLDDWTKQGLLQSYKIGNRVLYKRQEVEDSINQVQSFKFKKGGVR